MLNQLYKRGNTLDVIVIISKAILKFPDLNFL